MLLYTGLNPPHQFGSTLNKAVLIMREAALNVAVSLFKKL